MNFISNWIGKIKKELTIRKEFEAKLDEVVIYGVYINRMGIAYNVITGKLNPKLDFNLRFCIKTNVFSDFKPNRPVRHKIIISKEPVGEFYSKVKFSDHSLNKIKSSDGSELYEIKASAATKNYESGMLIESGHILFLTRKSEVLRQLNYCLDFSQEYYISFVEL